MMSDANHSELGNGVMAGGYDQNTDLDSVASEVQRIRRTERAGHDIGREVPLDTHWIGESTRYYLTPGGELVHVTPRDEGREVRVLFPERDSLDADGEPAPFAYTTSVENLTARMDADGGWKAISRFQILESPNCPRCNRFMSTGTDHTGFPFAQCQCGCDIGADEMIEQDAVVEVF